MKLKSSKKQSRSPITNIKRPIKTNTKIEHIAVVKKLPKTFRRVFFNKMPSMSDGIIAKIEKITCLAI